MSKRSRGQLAVTQLQSIKNKQIDVSIAKIPKNVHFISPKKDLDQESSNIDIQVTINNNIERSEKGISNEVNLSYNNLIPMNDPIVSKFDMFHLKLMKVFKVLDNVILSLHRRNKKCTWDVIIESYGTITSEPIDLNDLLMIQSIWKDAYIIKWIMKPYHKKYYYLNYELSIDLPNSNTNNCDIWNNIIQSTSLHSNDKSCPMDQPITLSPSFKANKSTTHVQDRILDFRSKLDDFLQQMISMEQHCDDLYQFIDQNLLPTSSSSSLSSNKESTNNPTDKESSKLIVTTTDVKIIDSIQSTKSPTFNKKKTISTSMNSMNEIKKEILSKCKLQLIKIQQYPNETNSKIQQKKQEYDTIEQLRQNAFEKSKEKIIMNHELVLQLEKEESQKISLLLPKVCDELRNICLYKNNNKIIYNEGIKIISTRLYIKMNQIKEIFEILLKIIPNFIQIQQEDKDNHIPMMIIIDMNDNYKQIRDYIMNYTTIECHL